VPADIEINEVTTGASLSTGMSSITESITPLNPRIYPGKYEHLCQVEGFDYSRLAQSLFGARALRHVPARGRVAQEKRRRAWRVDSGKCGRVAQAEAGTEQQACEGRGHVGSVSELFFFIYKWYTNFKM
jgi:hypothetical protein